MTTNVKPMKQGDLLPALQVACRYKDTTEDLAASVGLATPVVFIMRDRYNKALSPVIDRQPATIVSSASGVVTIRYDWQDGDTDLAGEYFAEFELDVGSAPLTAPTDGYILVRITNDLELDAGSLPPSSPSAIEVAIDAHEAEADPHPGYTTTAELATALSGLDLAGPVNTGIAAHVAAADPHPIYTTAAELSTAIAAIPAAPVASVNGLIGAVDLTAIYPTMTVMVGAGIDPTGVADSTTAIQTKINAGATAGAVYFFPTGRYKTTTPLVLPAQDSIFLGVPQLSGGGSRGSRLVNTVTDMFVPHASNTCLGVVFQDLSFQCGGGSGGHIFNWGNAGVSGCMWQRCVFVQQNTTKSVHYMVDGTYIDNLVIGGQVGIGSTATAPAWYYSSNGGAINRSTWTEMRWTGSGLYQLHIESTASGSYCYDNVIRNITAEIPTGGVARFWGCRNTLVEQVNTYDLGVVNPTTQHLFEFGKSAVAGALYSTGNTIRQCEVHNPRSLGSGLAHIHNSGGRLRVDDCNDVIDLNSTGANLVISPRNTSPAASIINSTDGDIIISQDRAAPWAPIVPPDSIGSGIATFDRRAGLADTATAQGTGDLILVYFTATKSVTVTAAQIWTGGTPAAATPTLCRFGLYTEDGSNNLTLVASTPNDTTLFATANTKYSKTFTAPYTTVKGQRYALGLIIVSAFTMPAFIGRAVGGGVLDAIYGELPRFLGRVAAQSDLTTPITAGSITNTRRNFYAEIA